MKHILIIAVLLIVSGCQHYSALPLNHDEVVERIHELRTQVVPNEQQSFSFIDAMQLMDKNNRRLMEIKQAYATLKEVEAIPTPLPNPSLNTGLTHGKDLPNDFSSATQPFVSLGFTVPLSSRLSKQDSVNSARANAQATMLKIEHRQLYLELRQVYGTLYFLQQKKQRLEKLTKFVEWKLEETKRFEETGIYTNLDQSVVKQQLNLVQLEHFALNEEILENSQKLSTLLDHPMKALNQMLFEKPPLYSQFNDSENELQSCLLENGLKIAEMRANYQVVEQQLQLEIAKQYPDLKIGANHRLEPGETKKFYGLTLGIDLPIFDQNQVEIAKVSGKRQELLSSYHKIVSTALIESDYLLERLENSFNRYIHHDEKVLTQTHKNRDLAQKSFQSGRISLLRYWEFEEEVIKHELKSVANYINFWAKQSNLEQLLGSPLTQFTNEPKPTKTTEKEND